MVAYGNDVGSIIGGLLSGFSGTYFPMRERRRDDELARDRLEIARQQNEIMNQMRQDEAQWKGFERAKQLRDWAAEDEWNRSFLGTGATHQVTPQVAPQVAPQVQGGGVLDGMGLGRFPVTSGFGPRTPPMPGASANHQGVDVAAPAWTPVTAPFGGQLAYGQDPKGGNWVGVTDGQGRSVKALHLSDFGPEITRGQARPGDVIGYTGSSGVSTGPHAHVSTLVGGSPVDPAQFGQQAGVQYAQAGPRTATDAGGPGASPIQRFLAMPAEQAAAMIASAPKSSRETMAALWKMANEKKDATSYQVIKGGDGRQYRFDPKTGKAAPIEGLPESQAGPNPLEGLEKLDAREVVAKLSDGYQAGTLPPAQKALYEVSFAALFGKDRTMPDGSKETASRPQSIAAPPLTADATSGARPLTAESATKAASMQEALKATDALESAYLDGDKFKTSLAARSNIPLVGSMPFDTEGRNARTNTTFAIESILRGLSGAGVPESEVTRYRDMLSPSVGDTAESFRLKLERTRGILRGSLSAMGPAADRAASLNMAPAHNPNVIRYDSQGNRVD